VSTMHVTSSIFVNDHESGLYADIMKWLEELAPFGQDYQHHLTGEDNADAHLKRMILGHQVLVPVTTVSSTSGRGNAYTTVSSMAGATNACCSKRSGYPNAALTASPSPRRAPALISAARSAVGNARAAARAHARTRSLRSGRPDAGRAVFAMP